MSAAAKPVRPSKRDVIVIDGDDSANGQPATKSVKIEEEEPVPSSEVIELQHKVLKLEEMFQRACRAARVAELRAEEAESKLDSKYGVRDDFHAEKKRADDLEKRLAEVLSELVEATRMKEKNADTAAELTRENEVLKTAQAAADEAHQEKLSEVSSQLKGARRRAANVFLNNTLIGTNLSESTNSEQQDRVKYLTDQLEKEKQRVNEDRTIYRTRVNELMQRIDKQKHEIDEERRRAREDRTRYHARIEGLKYKLSKYEKEEEPVEIDHSVNIFQPCRPDSIKSISYERAREKLFAAAMKLDGGTLDTKLNLCFDRFPELQSLIIECRVCKVVTLQQTSLIMHFLGKPHENKMSACDGAVYRAALEFWLDKLKPDAQPMQQLQQWPRDRCINQLQLPTAAAAVAAAPQHAAVDPPALHPEVAAGSNLQLVAAAVSALQPIAAAAASPEVNEMPEEMEEGEIDD